MSCDQRWRRIGGTVNLTPLGVRYLDQIGVGDHIRENSLPLTNGIDYVSLRTGSIMGNFWGNIGAVRISRNSLVDALMGGVEKSGDKINILWGKKTTEIVEDEDKITVRFADGDSVSGDVLFGCDGIHSAARRLFVEPERGENFIGKVVAMGWKDDVVDDPMFLANGRSGLIDTSLFRGQKGMLLTSYYEKTKTKVFLAHMTRMKEPKVDENGDIRDVWKVLGDDKEKLKQDVLSAYEDGNVKGLEDFAKSCEEWTLYPIHILPGDGKWSEGRVHLLGDAAHAVSQLGEVQCKREVYKY